MTLPLHYLTCVYVCCFMMVMSIITGAIFPPMFIITGRSEAKYEQFVPIIAGYSVIATEKAYIDSHSWLEWMKKVFIPYAKPTPDKRVLLLIDNLRTHLTFDSVKYASDHGVDIFPFPPRASHILQPLDVGVFGPLKTLVEIEWLDAMLQHEDLDILMLIRSIMKPSVFDKAFASPSIVKGWMDTGLRPFDPNKIDHSRLTPDEKKATTHCSFPS